MNIQFPDVLRPFLGKNLTWKIQKPSSKVIYLTFDDGPVPEVTPAVLDLLEKEQIKATFFCIGENVERNHELFNKILLRGHHVGNHTFNHIGGFSCKTKKYVENVQKANLFIKSHLFRPPYGHIMPCQIHALKNDYKIVLWDIITHDYNQKLSIEKVLTNVTKYSRAGSIVVFHDSLKARKTMLAVLPQAIAFWKKEGYEFGVL